MVRRRSSTEEAHEDNAPFYETVNMPRSGSSSIYKPTNVSFLKKIDERTTVETNAFFSFFCNVFGRVLVALLLMNGFLFAFFGCGAEFPGQRSKTVPSSIESTPIKTVPRIN